MVQRILLSEGYRIGRPDGEVGPATREGIARYQSNEGLRITGRIDGALMAELTDEWGVGDARARNDRSCVQARLRGGGAFEREPAAEPDVLPAPDQSDRTTRSDTGGRRLRCPANRIQDGRTCVCRPGLFEDATGACRPESGPIPQATPETNEAPARPIQEACSSGRRRASNGQCVCLPGTVDRDGQCISRKRQAACSGGKERNSNGRCACPRGLQDIEGICQLPQDTTPPPRPKKKVIKNKPTETKKARPKKARPAKRTPEQSEKAVGNSCTNNMVMNVDGKCQCYLNLKNSDGKCLVKVRAKCLPGEVINVRGKCECPTDRKIQDGKCILRQ